MELKFNTVNQNGKYNKKIQKNKFKLLNILYLKSQIQIKLEKENQNYGEKLLWIYDNYIQKRFINYLKVNI